MAERNIDPGGGSVEPHDNQSPRNGEKGSDQRRDVGAQPPEVGFSVPEASVKLEKEGGMKKAPNETKSDSPLSHQVSLEQSEAKQKPQPVAQKWTVPLSRFIPKRIPKTSSTQDSVQPSPKRNKRSEKKKRYKQNKKKRKELEARQHQDDQSKSSVGDTPPASDTEMEFDDAQQEQEETSHNTAFSSESQDQEEQTSKNDTLQSETAVMVPSDSSHVVQDSRPPLETKGENKIPSIATSGPEGNHRDVQGSSVPPLEPVGASETQGEPNRKATEVSTSIPVEKKVFGNNDTMQSVTAVLVPSDNCHVVQDSMPPSETKGENKGEPNRKAVEVSTSIPVEKKVFGNRNSSYQTGQNQSSRGDELSGGSTVLSKTGAAETQIILVLHAFIEPKHWGRTPENVRVEVRCELSWEENNAVVHCRKLPDSPVCAVESTLKLPARSSFPFEYKYYVSVSHKPEDCYEHLTHPTRAGGKVNRCIFSKDQLLPGKEAHTYHHCDDFILPSPKSSVFGVLKSLFGIKSESTAMDAKSAELREDGILLHLDRMTNKLLSFIAGAEGHGDELISHIVLTCRQVNDHLVVANVDWGRKIGPAAFGKTNVQKLVKEWILKLAKRERADVLDYQQSVSDVAKLQAIGLVAIVISEAVLPKGTNVKITANELDDVAKLLSYHGLPLKHILECQEVVCKTISTLETKAVQSALCRFIVLLANKKNTTRILDAVLLLSSWSGNLDVWQYIVKEHRSLITPLQHAFASVLVAVRKENQHQRLTNTVSNTEFWKHGSFGQFVLEIIPPRSWEVIARYIPLQIVFKCLDEFLRLNKSVDSQVLDSLLLHLCWILQQPNSDT